MKYYLLIFLTRNVYSITYHIYPFYISHKECPLNHISDISILYFSQGMSTQSHIRYIHFIFLTRNVHSITYQLYPFYISHKECPLNHISDISILYFSQGMSTQSHIRYIHFIFLTRNVHSITYQIYPFYISRKECPLNHISDISILYFSQGMSTQSDIRYIHFIFLTRNVHSITYQIYPFYISHKECPLNHISDISILYFSQGMSTQSHIRNIHFIFLTRNVHSITYQIYPFYISHKECPLNHISDISILYFSQGMSTQSHIRYIHYIFLTRNVHSITYQIYPFYISRKECPLNHISDISILYFSQGMSTQSDIRYIHFIFLTRNVHSITYQIYPFYISHKECPLNHISDISILYFSQGMSTQSHIRYIHFIFLTRNVHSITYQIYPFYISHKECPLNHISDISILYFSQGMSTQSHIRNIHFIFLTRNVHSITYQIYPFYISHKECPLNHISDISILYFSQGMSTQSHIRYIHYIFLTRNVHSITYQIYPFYISRKECPLNHISDISILYFSQGMSTQSDIRYIHFIFLTRNVHSITYQIYPFYISHKECPLNHISDISILYFSQGMSTQSHIRYIHFIFLTRNVHSITYQIYPFYISHKECPLNHISDISILYFSQGMSTQSHIRNIHFIFLTRNVHSITYQIYPFYISHKECPLNHISDISIFQITVVEW